jgi:DNA adenine methylase Dam
MLKTPLNYAGSKTELMSQLLKYFPSPEDVATFYDVFAGGLSVTVNSDYNQIVSNDVILPLIKLWEIIYKNDTSKIITKLLEYQIDKTDSEAFLKMRKEYNVNKNNPFIFFGLVSSCTNNLMRFNLKGEFNQTFGKRSINDNTIKKLVDYAEKMKTKDITFTNYSFEDILSKATNKDFVYLDPPYAMTSAGYNAVWNADKELLLQQTMDELTDRGVKWAFSGVSIHKGIENPNMKFLSKYKVIELEQSYEKVAKVKGLESQEILVINY